MGQINSIDSPPHAHHTLSSIPELSPATNGQSPNLSTPFLPMDTSSQDPSTLKHFQRSPAHQTILTLVKRLIIPSDITITLSTPDGTESSIPASSSPISRKRWRSSMRWSKAFTTSDSTPPAPDKVLPRTDITSASASSDQSKDKCEEIERDVLSYTDPPVLSSEPVISDAKTDNLSTASQLPSIHSTMSPLSQLSSMLDSTSQETNLDHADPNHFDITAVSSNETKQTTTPNRHHLPISRPQSVDGNIPAMYSTPPSPTFATNHIPIPSTTPSTTDNDTNTSPTSRAVQHRKRGQQVRFATTATLSLYLPESSILSPSSPTFSIRSLSSNPISPLPPHPSHTFLSPLPPQIHRLLRSNHDIRYDLTRPPITAIMHNCRPLSHRVLSEPASYPGMIYLEIICPYLPRRIPVRAPSLSISVSVSDVLATLYMTLRKNASERAYRALMPEDQRQVRHAYKRRYSNMRHPQAYEAEKQGGLKKVDLLMEKKWFAGFKTTDAPNVWMLQVT